MPAAVRQLIIGIAVTVFTALGALAQDAGAPAFPWEGEVSGNNVYVRSGAGPNWYPTTKLGSGERILVLGEKFGWYQIAPPPGSFSYVDMAMVERKAGAGTGIITQDKVYVRAGSTLEKRKNATQLVLNKGDAVEIIGESEGFYKILPPPAASLYISKQYVKPVEPRQATGLAQRRAGSMEQAGAVNAAAEPAVQSAAKPGADSAETPSSKRAPDAPSSVAAVDSTPDSVAIPPSQDSSLAESSGQGAMKAVADDKQQALAAEQKVDMLDAPDAAGAFPTASADKKPAAAGGEEKPAFDSAFEPAGKVEPAQGRYQAMLLACESELVSLVSKPLDQQEVTALLERYEEIAAQSEEHVPAEVAKIRVRQLRDRAKLRTEHLASHQDEKDLAEYRATMETERMRIMRRRVEAALQSYDLEGELRRSMAFAPESRRYRLVDPASESTIAYVDVPRTVDENPEHLIGRRVGISVAGQTFSPSARVPIAVARKVVDLTPRQGIPVQPAKPSTDESNGSTTGGDDDAVSSRSNEADD